MHLFTTDETFFCNFEISLYLFAVVHRVILRYNRRDSNRTLHACVFLRVAAHITRIRTAI